VYAATAAFRKGGVAPEDVDVIQLQTPTQVPELHPYGRVRLCADSEQEKLLADGAPRSTASCRSTPTAGLIANGEPIGASGLRKSTSWCASCVAGPATAGCR